MWRVETARLKTEYPDAATEIAAAAERFSKDLIYSRSKNSLTIAENIRRMRMELLRTIVDGFDPAARLTDPARRMDTGPGGVDVVEAIGAAADWYDVPLHWSARRLAALIERLLADQPDLDSAAIIDRATAALTMPLGLRVREQLVVFVQALMLLGARRPGRVIRTAAGTTDPTDHVRNRLRTAIAALGAIPTGYQVSPTGTAPFDLLWVAALVLIADDVARWPDDAVRQCVGDHSDGVVELFAEAVVLDSQREWWVPSWTPIGVRILDSAASPQWNTFADRDIDLMVGVARHELAEKMLRHLVRSALRASGGRFADLLAVQSFLTTNFNRQTWSGRMMRLARPTRVEDNRSSGDDWRARPLPPGWGPTLGAAVDRRAYIELSAARDPARSSHWHLARVFAAYLHYDPDPGDTFAEAVVKWAAATAVVGIQDNRDRTVLDLFVEPPQLSHGDATGDPEEE